MGSRSLYSQSLLCSHPWELDGEHRRALPELKVKQNKPRLGLGEQAVQTVILVLINSAESNRNSWALTGWVARNPQYPKGTLEAWMTPACPWKMWEWGGNCGILDGLHDYFSVWREAFVIKQYLATIVNSSHAYIYEPDPCSNIKVIAFLINNRGTWHKTSV